MGERYYITEQMEIILKIPFQKILDLLVVLTGSLWGSIYFTDNIEKAMATER